MITCRRQGTTRQLEGKSNILGEAPRGDAGTDATRLVLRSLLRRSILITAFNGFQRFKVEAAPSLVQCCVDVIRQRLAKLKVAKATSKVNRTKRADGDSQGKR